MDFEAAILMAIAMAITAHFCVRPVAVSSEWLTYVAAHQPVCTDVEMGSLCAEITAKRRVDSRAR